MDRLRGFGCRVLACDLGRTTSAEYVSLDVLLRDSDLSHPPRPPDGGHPPSPQSSTYRADAARRLHRRHRTRRTARHRGSARRPGKRPLGARHWKSSKVRKEYSTPTTGRSIENRLLSRMQQLPNVLITPHTAYYTDHALSDIVENTLANCRRFERRPSGSIEDRNHLRRLLRGTSRVGQVGARGGAAPRSRKVRALLHRDHHERRLEAVRRPSREWERHACRPAMLSPDRSVHGCSFWSRDEYETIRLDVVFPCCTAGCGEDGAIQGLLELSGIPYVGATSRARPCAWTSPWRTSSLEAQGSPRRRSGSSRRTRRSTSKASRYPVFVKPARSGSSFGVSKVSGEKNCRARWRPHGGTTRRC